VPAGAAVEMVKSVATVGMGATDGRERSVNTCLIMCGGYNVEVCVAVCCSVLQCVAVCCSVLQCVLQRADVLLCVAATMLRCVLQCVAVCCSVLQCVAVCVAKG